MSELYRLVRRLREDGAPSRNRDYDEMSQPLARRARRIHLRLRGIERELRSGARIEVRRGRVGYVLRLAFPAVRVEREAYLTDEEHALLCADPGIARVLQAVTDGPREVGEGGGQERGERPGLGLAS